MALRQTAHEVDIREVDPDKDGQPAPSDESSPGERILVHITPDPSTAVLIRRAWRVAEFIQAGCVAVYVRSPAHHVSQWESETVEKHLRFARDLHIETRVLEGDREAETLVDFARLSGVTQIYIARPRYKPWQRLFTTNPVHRIVRLAPDMRLIIVAGRN